GLVDRAPQRYAAPEFFEQHRGVVREPARHVSVPPAAAILEHLRQVPMEEREHGRDAGLEQRVHEPVVERQAGLVHAPRASGEHPAPGDREAIGAEPERAHLTDVLAPEPVMAAGDVAGHPVPSLPGRVSEAVPDALAGAVREWRALDLICRSRCTPKESRGEWKLAVQWKTLLSQEFDIREQKNSVR